MGFATRGSQVCRCKFFQPRRSRSASRLPSRFAKGVRNPTLTQHDLRYLFWSFTYDDFVDELVDEHEIGPQVLFFQNSAKVVNSPYYGSEKLQSKSGDDFATGRGEDKEQLVALDVCELDALSFLQ